MFYQLADALVDNVADMDLEDPNIASAAAGALSSVLGSGAVSADSLVSLFGAPLALICNT